MSAPVGTVTVDAPDAILPPRGSLRWPPPVFSCVSPLKSSLAIAEPPEAVEVRAFAPEDLPWGELAF